MRSTTWWSPSRASKLTLYASLMVGLVAVEGVFRYGMRTILIGLSREVEYELRNDVFAHLTRLDARYYQRNRDRRPDEPRHERPVRRCAWCSDPASCTRPARSPPSWARSRSWSRISPRLLLLSLLPLVLVSLLVRHFGRRIHDRFEGVQAQLSTMTALVQENLSGARVVRAYAQETAELARFAEVNEEYVHRNRRLVRMYGALYPGIQLLMGTGTVVVLWLGGRQVVAGAITLGEFVAFGAYLTHAALADDRARLGGQHLRARRGVDGAASPRCWPSAPAIARRRAARVPPAARRAWSSAASPSRYDAGAAGAART